MHFVASVRAEAGRSVAFDPAFDIDALANEAATLPDLRLLILDPIVSIVPGDSHKNSETRRALQPLVDLAQQRSIAVLGITHFSKGTAGRDPAERVTGSLAFTASPRLVMVAVKPRDVSESRRLVRAKSNLGPDGGGFEYWLDRAPLHDRPDILGQYVVWGDPLEGPAIELLAELESADGEDDSKLDAAQAFLVEFLGEQMVMATQVFEEAKRAGHSPTTIRRAQRKLGIRPAKSKDHWFWSLPDGRFPKSTQDNHGIQTQDVGHLGHLADSDAQDNQVGQEIGVGWADHLAKT
jgi:putative DNA primase/helicase